MSDTLPLGTLVCHGFEILGGIGTKKSRQIGVPLAGKYVDKPIQIRIAPREQPGLQQSKQNKSNRLCDPNIIGLRVGDYSAPTALEHSALPHDTTSMTFMKDPSKGFG